MINKYIFSIFLIICATSCNHLSTRDISETRADYMTLTQIPFQDYLRFLNFAGTTFKINIADDLVELSVYYQINDGDLQKILTLCPLAEPITLSVITSQLNEENNTVSLCILNNDYKIHQVSLPATYVNFATVTPLPNAFIYNEMEKVYSSNIAPDRILKVYILLKQVD